MMKKQVIIAIAAFLGLIAGLHADTSYLLIQGPFGSAGASETFKWTINYQAGTVVTGQDLLNDVFGAPMLTGTYTNYLGETFNLYTASNGTVGVSYIDYGTDPSTLTEPFIISFTLGGATISQDTSYINTWSYYVAGGAGGNGGNNIGGPYPNNGSWVFSNDGLAARTLSNGSFDAWTFGSSSNPPPVTGASNTPVATNFPATVPFVPEPAGLIGLTGGLGVLGLLRRRSQTTCNSSL